VAAKQFPAGFYIVSSWTQESNQWFNPNWLITPVQLADLNHHEYIC
jgi:hypothetical protein